MPEFRFAERVYDIPRNIALLDTNVLVALFDQSDQWHNEATCMLEFDEYRWAVPISALIEAWNFLAGRRGKVAEAYQLTNWLLTPGSVILLDEESSSLESPHYATSKFKIDIVDACIMQLADRLTSQCGIAPPVYVATCDTRDFLRCFGSAGFKYSIIDMRDGSIIGPV